MAARLTTADDMIDLVLGALPIDAPATIEVHRLVQTLRYLEITDDAALARLRTADDGALRTHPTSRAALAWLAMVSRPAYFTQRYPGKELDQYFRATKPWTELSFIAEYQRARFARGLSWQRGLMASLQDPRTLRGIPIRWRPEPKRSQNGEPDALVWLIHQHSPRAATEFAIEMVHRAPDRATQATWVRIGLSATYRYVSPFPRKWRAMGIVSPRARVPIASLGTYRRALQALQRDFAAQEPPPQPAPVDAPREPAGHAALEASTTPTPTRAMRTFGEAMANRTTRARSAGR